ncbi:MAG: SoxR reducing system RseC family protein [Christensenellaceae bacterium]|jgi:sigma-E factor negative regulatory protein RseC
MKEAGEIINVDNGMAYMNFRRTSACASCGACGMLKGQDEITVQVENTLQAKEGDRVEVEFTAKNALQSSMIGYIFPLVMLIVGVLVGYNVPQSLFDVQDAFAAVLGIIFTAASFVVLKLLNPVFAKRFRNTYKMVRIVDEE